MLTGLRRCVTAPGCRSTAVHTLCAKLQPRVCVPAAPVRIFERGYVLKNTQNYWAHSKKEMYDESAVEEWKAAFPNLSKFSNDEVTQWRDAFRQIDSDKDGVLSPADILKHPVFGVDKTELFRKFDRDENNLIDFGEFVDAMHDLDLKCLKEAFKGFDPVDLQLEFEKYAVAEAQGAKKITVGGLKQLMTDHEFTVVSETDAQWLFEKMSKGKSQLGLKEFRDFFSD
uniref:EF-hand domain-containing protein n=1 Tax=Chromera velia CCMP2878 TaxID=1169474 RepID=A0A0G4H4E7_9ALVE|mmetsp:Transcript_53141/g.104017  ORF Transcript_53141/g.104017 Transcript_53141/m.104017 type:complete len:227 (+) Transcript_53141:154-834(+)|eukprot:Cvel_24594.t1-p1 / transcript=Cvel_24594.t1 / gene=Cvel_24594 / organism=Chromera_velia_CCMP2878 / gene_product=hypothetical protein / transcript_product=hypothetical protein / location=Cvel_scaffold2678:14473-16677(+) / protein_length=226 / sequence_SO=supercontig / SO=protein_coding / is_pseudo=false